MKNLLICNLAIQVLKVQLCIPTKLILFGWVVPFVIPFFFIASFFIYELTQHFGYFYFYSALLICLILYSQAKFHSFAYLDPIHLFPWSIDSVKKRVFIFLCDLLGLKLTLFVGFGIILVFNSPMPLVDLAVLFVFYAGFTSLDIALLEQSLRKKVIRVIYKYVYLLILTFCMANTRFFLFRFLESCNQVDLQARWHLWYQANWSMGMLVTLIVFMGSLLLFLTKDNVGRQQKPFIVEFNDFNRFF